MRKHYKLNRLFYVLITFLLIVLASCHKGTSISPTNSSQTKIALIEFKGQGSDYKGYTYFESDIPILSVGNQTVNYQVTFDTGSGGLVLDASTLIPSTMITTSGFNFTGDSTVVNGITITNQKATLKYGANDATSDKVYGNLAFAQVTIGDNNGSVVVKRLPFLLYYKAVDANNNPYPAQYFNIFGSAEIYDQTFANNVNLTTPFSFCTVGSGLTKGYKMAAIDSSQYSTSGNYVKGAITLGLTSSDLASNSGFVMNQLSFDANNGYLPYLKSNITYGSSSFTSYVLFDSGTNYCAYLGDPNSTGSFTQVSANTHVNVTTTLGFNYNFTVTPNANLSFVEKPATGYASISIMGIEYFFKNEYLLDLSNHQLGLKNN